MLVIISSPSGGGKDAVIQKLLEIFPNSAKLVTTTTRAPRPDEENGISYFFVSKPEFEEKIKNGDFIEYNLYAENWYGTDKRRVAEMTAKYDLVFTNIEVNGKQNFDKAGIKNLSIFLLPESMDMLKERIQHRGQMDEKTLSERMKTAEKELEQSKTYDFKVMNKQGKLDETAAEVAEIVGKALAQNHNVDKKTRIG